MARNFQQPYIFRVFVITNGDLSGLLVEKKEAGLPDPKYAYFWHEGPYGLAATKEIMKYCGGNRHPIELPQKYEHSSHKHNSLQDQERIYLELLNYARAAAEANKDYMHDERMLFFDYSEYKSREYAGTLNRLFHKKKKSAFKDFFVNQNVFSSFMLESPKGRDTLIGHAVEFAFRDPHNPFPEEDLIDLSTVQEVLEVENPPNAEWFRKTGPVISDFTDKVKRVHRRSEVDLLKDKLSDEGVFLLEGVAASGKSVIVRTLMLELYEAGETRVYYFDVTGKRHFNEDQLIREMRRVKGIFIIENVHLESRKIQYIYQKFKNDSERNILFTTRRSYEEFQDEFLQDLGEIPKITLDPFVDVKEIIKLYCADPKTPTIVWEKREDILEISEQNFWLFAWALQGCTTAKGQGDPRNWIKDEIQRYLRNLENCQDQYADQYPEILVALSPLYMNEVQTVGTYLKKLGFQKKALNRLVERGEITRQKDSYRGALYGLPHSALAFLYWYCRSDFWDRGILNNYVDFIADYVRSKNPNSLETLVRTCLPDNDEYIFSSDNILKRTVLEENEDIDFLLEEVCNDGTFVKLIEQEIDLHYVESFLNYLLYHKEKVNLVQIHHDVFVEKMIDSTDPITSIWCMIMLFLIEHDYGMAVWKKLDKQTFRNLYMQILDNSGGFLFGALCKELQAASSTAWSELGMAIDKQHIAEQLNSETVSELKNCLGVAWDARSEVCIELCELLRPTRIAEVMEQLPAFEFGRWLTAIRSHNPDMAKEICNEMDLLRQIRRLSMDRVGVACIADICRTSPHLISRLLPEINDLGLMRMIEGIMAEIGYNEHQ
ncbi:hypothetical protein ACFL5F_03280 [Planctomycetota bacterium]